MKKIFLALLLMLPLFANAKGTLDKKYLKGGVPEENGMIVFQKAFSVQGKTQAEIYATLYNYIEGNLIANAIKDLRTKIISDGKDDNTIVAKIEEYMIFKKKPLYLDRTRFRYQISANVQNNKVKMQITQISYYYDENIEGQNGTSYKAEEWISDAEAINKAGTKLYPRSGKFRIKTIDRISDIFEEAMNAFEVKEPVVEVKKRRSNIVED